MAGKIGEGSIKAAFDKGRDEIAQHMLGQPAPAPSHEQQQAPETGSYAAAIQEQREAPQAPEQQQERSR